MSGHSRRFEKISMSPKIIMKVWKLENLTLIRKETPVIVNGSRSWLTKIPESQLRPWPDTWECLI